MTVTKIDFEFTDDGAIIVRPAFSDETRRLGLTFFVSPDRQSAADSAALKSIEIRHGAIVRLGELTETSGLLVTDNDGTAELVIEPTDVPLYLCVVMPSGEVASSSRITAREVALSTTA